MSTSPDEKDPSPDGSDSPHGFPGWFRARPVLFASLFEGGLGVLAVVLALLFGLQPWANLELSMFALVISLAATSPLLAIFHWLRQAGWRWARELQEIVEQGLVPLFRGTGPIGIGLVAVMAGVGEELLFRGVIQAGLEGPLGTWGALIVASLVFGLAHCVSRAYFLVTTVIGFYLGLIYIWTGNLLIPILIHALYDWFALRYYLQRRD